jgi:hypothetical protein
LLGLSKVAHRKSRTGRKSTKEQVAAETTAVKGEIETAETAGVVVVLAWYFTVGWLFAPKKTIFYLTRQ